MPAVCPRVRSSEQFVRFVSGPEMHTRAVNLRRLAHERIEAGELPPDRPGLMRDGQGSGEPCALCGAPVVFDEVECVLAGDLPARTFKFHLACYTVWVTESLGHPGGA